MLKIVLATRNPGKKKEIQNLLEGLPIEIQNVEDYPNCPESSEPYDNYRDNALDKARIVSEYCGEWALADDSGLEVDYLQGKPGVYSARYAGEGCTYEDNYQKILQAMQGVSEQNRGAQFRCLMILHSHQGKILESEGVLAGRIALKPSGKEGFGYDPIFLLEHTQRTLAQLKAEEKNQISHRKKALDQMIQLIQRHLIITS